jgi:hypothetical protein
MFRQSKDRPGVRTQEASEDIARMLAAPPPSLEELFNDPGVRWRVGERISLAMTSPAPASRRRTRARPRAPLRRES